VWVRGFRVGVEESGWCRVGGLEIVWCAGVDLCELLLPERVGNTVVADDCAREVQSANQGHQRDDAPRRIHLFF